MKVTYWHPTRCGDDQTGVRRYEDRVASGVHNAGVDVTRVRLPRGRVRGCTPVSWALDYTRSSALVHSTEETVAPVALFRPPEKHVVTCHGLIPLRYPELQESPIVKAQWRFVPRALRIADHVIAVSEFTKQECIDLLDLDPSKISVIYHGVDDRFQPMPRGEALSHFGLSQEPFYVLIMSSGLPQKRMDVARDVIGRLGDYDDSIRFITTGYGTGLEGTINPGWIPEEDLPLLYNAADVLYHPSEYESFGLPLLEAMACGTRVVASNATAIPEVVGDVGTLIEPGDPTVASLAILSEIGRGTDQDAVHRASRFSWEEAVRRTISVYDISGT